MRTHTCTRKAGTPQVAAYIGAVTDMGLYVPQEALRMRTHASRTHAHVLVLQIEH